MLPPFLACAPAYQRIYNPHLNLIAPSISLDWKSPGFTDHYHPHCSDPGEGRKMSHKVTPPHSLGENTSLSREPPLPFLLYFPFNSSPSLEVIFSIPYSPEHSKRRRQSLIPEDPQGDGPRHTPPNSLTSLWTEDSQEAARSGEELTGSQRPQFRARSSLASSPGAWGTPLFLCAVSFIQKTDNLCPIPLDLTG